MLVVGCLGSPGILALLDQRIDMKAAILIEDLFKLKQKEAPKGMIMGHYGKAGSYLF